MSAESDMVCPKCGFEWSAIPPSKCPACNPPDAAMTVADMLLQIPQRWRAAEIAIGNSIGDALPVKRIALHRDRNGRRVVAMYSEKISVK
jgi:hypothetical protein